MRTKQGNVATLLVALLILTTASSALVDSSHSTGKSFTIVPVQTTFMAQYESSEPLLITDNADFERLGATGDGSLSDPFTFSNLRISNTSSCIRVANTTARFVISNCRLESDDLSPVIVFDNVENGRVEQCHIVGLSAGLDIWQSRDCFSVENSFIGLWHGVRLRYSSSCLVIDNTIRSNRRGVVFQESGFCDILNNSIYDNSEFGIFIDLNSYNNSIHGNAIGWNDRNVWDVGANNTFDDGSSIGNAWSDFNASEPYFIPGTSGAIDAFAQHLNDSLDPGIVPLENMAIDVETSGNTITWTVYDLYLVSYAILENEEISLSSMWFEGDITYGLDHLTVGTHTITLVVYDAAGNADVDEVLVTAISFLLGGIGTELVLFASGITVACFVIIILLIKRLS